MAQSQARDGAGVFNPPSPHSSNGAAESCKHDGTPDTRLTAFSPEESSTRSAKLMATIASGSSDGGSTNYSTNQAVPYRTDQSPVERDPFVSTDTPARKQEQKLSATASAFRPYGSPLIAQGSGDAASEFSPGKASSIQQTIPSIPTTLSTEGLLSRCIVVSSSSQLVGQNDLELLLSVCLSRPIQSITIFCMKNSNKDVEIGSTWFSMPRNKAYHRQGSCGICSILEHQGLMHGSPQYSTRRTFLGSWVCATC